jgi:Bacterial Ig-like domain (group 3)
MFRSHRLRAVRIYLLIAGFVLLSATSALATSTHRSHAGPASRLHDTSHTRASAQRGSGGRSSSARRGRCAAARGGERRRADRSCVAGKQRVAGARKRPRANGPATPSVVSVGAQAPAIDGPPPAEALEVPGPETAPPAESPGGSDESPATITPPVEESKPPVEVPPTEKASTTTTLVSSTNPSMVRQPVTYTATVSPAAAAGTVAFDEAGTPIAGCAAQPVGSGAATCTLSGYATAGEHAITATYDGDGSYLASASSASKQVVDKTGTTKATMTLASSLDPSTVGEAVTYTATLDTTAATGTVEFKQAGVTITGCAAQPISAGNAQCTVVNPSSGWRLVTAIYSGDSNYATAASSSGLGQSVSKKITTLTPSSSLDPSTVGETVTYTATLSTTAATGTVEFKQAGTAISGCAARPISAGTATCAVVDLAAGGVWIAAVYSGDSNYAASSSTILTETVKKRTTTTAVSSSMNPLTVGEAVTYTATVSPAAASGTVEFEEEGAPIVGCTAEIISSGTATCTVTGNSKRYTYGITAAYSGDSSDLASTSSMFTQIVEPPAGSTAPFRFFSPTSFWNQKVPADAELDPNSAALIDAFNEGITAGKQIQKGPAINTTAWSVPIYTVPANQPTVEVKLERASRSLALQSAWEEVPLPANAQPAAGTDKHLVIWQPSTDKLWEFWRLEYTASGWRASWGGAIQNASSNSGAYGPEAWPDATSRWGASASSLSIAGGLITLEDLEMGQINHALAIAIPNPRAGVYASPAERTDGLSTEPLSLPEGAHLRLEPNLDLASLHLPRLTLILAEAAQRYGIIVRDTAGNVAFYAQDPISTGTEPYTGANGYFEGKSPAQLLASFPWSHLQLLKMDLHSGS